MSLIFRLNSDGGFFCQLWQVASNILYARNCNLQFFIDDSQWMFKHTRGWRDYFTSLHVLSEHDNIPQPIHEACDVNDGRLHQYTLSDYMSVCKEIYCLHEELLHECAKQKHGLSTYDSIMIRRGDKMYWESRYITTNRYVDVLRQKGLRTLFVQTDDYTSYEEVCKHVSPEVYVITTCPSTKRGAFVFNYQPSAGSATSELNNSYLLQLATVQQKCVNTYSPEEMKDHVNEMLIGLKICMDSEYLSTDFQSNVTRFLVCCHNNPKHVFSVDSELPSYDVKLKCPAHGFIVM